MSVKTWILAGAALLTFVAPASAATFTTIIGTPVGGPEGNCSGRGTTQSAAPIAVTGQCASPAQLNTNAAALFGHVGAGASAAGVPGYFGSGFGMNASAQFDDMVTFTSTNPGMFITTVATNLHFSGDIAVTTGGSAGVGLFFAMGGFWALDATNRGVQRNLFQIVSGTVSGGASDAILRTGTGQVFLNQPQRLTMRISAGAGGSGAASSRSDFSNSFEIPFGMDVFVLPPGVTANAGDWLVNNRRVAPNAVNPIPEPGTWAMLIAGFGMIGGSLRRRRRAVVLA